MRGRGGKKEYRWAKKLNTESLEAGKFHTAVGTANIANHIPEIRNEMTSMNINEHAATSSKQSLLTEKCCAKPSILSRMQIKAAYYPKFKNDKSGCEVRDQMLETVSKGLAILEVSLKHSGYLFMFSGHRSGAYARNNYGNIYTAIGIFVLGRMFREAWGIEAKKKQMEFNDYLERNHVCLCMKLVTAVMQDFGQRPREDYVVVTAVVKLGSQKPKFYSTANKIAFCQQWHLPTNNMWLFSTRKTVTKFFAAYDALREEATATLICKVLDDIADLSVPGFVDFIKVQGEILEGLVVRLVNHASLMNLKEVLTDSYLPLCEKGVDLGPNLRQVCAANRSDEKQQIRALLHSVGTSFCPDHSDWFGDGIDDSYTGKTDVSVLSDFLQAYPFDEPTAKLKEICNLMRQKRYPATVKFYEVGQSSSSFSGTRHYKMAIYTSDDSSFRKHQSEMRSTPELWPLYRGLFVDIYLFASNSENVAEVTSNLGTLEQDTCGGYQASGEDNLADDETKLMIILKFLTYKLRASLMRDGLAVLSEGGHGAYKAYYLRKMKSWHTSSEKQWALSKMLDEWAVYILRKYSRGQLSSSLYLTVAEPFLQQYAARCSENGVLIGSAGHLVKAEDFLAITEEIADNSITAKIVEDVALSSWNPSAECSLAKDETLVIFFVGMPGSTKSGICREILNYPGGLGDGRHIRSIMGSSFRGKYWQKIAQECRMKPSAILLADKNAPNEEVWWQIEDMCRSTKASAIPVIPDSEGTESNPFTLEALSVFMSRVIQRDYHPGKLDRSSPRAGYVMLNFYHIHDGKGREQFESELLQRFGSLVKIPLLKTRRNEMPKAIRSILMRGINLYKCHYDRYGCSVESVDGSYVNEWIAWEKELQGTILDNADYLNNIQVSFEVASMQVIAQLRTIATGEHVASSLDKRDSGPIMFAAIGLSPAHVLGILNDLVATDTKIAALLEYKHTDLINPYILLAHKRTHGVMAVASYAPLARRKVSVELTAILVSDNTLAIEVVLGSVDGERLTSKDEWPHATLWIGKDEANEAGMLPQLLSEAKAARMDISPPVNVDGTIQFY